MSNSAYITTKKNYEIGGIAIYVHWNGGRDSVEGFLKYCELKGYRAPNADGYGWARLAQVIGNFFGGTVSVGIEYIRPGFEYCSDNGFYIIEGWKIVDRKNPPLFEQKNWTLNKMLFDIDNSMPKEEQLGQDFFNSKEVKTTDINVGDTVVFYHELDSKYITCKVEGLGDGVVNGFDRTGIPYVDVFGEDHKKNPNNYIMTETVRKLSM